ncbi:MAG TPA: heme o synthase [Thermoleophilia bacterium]|nr:heme o synthase [Thermoleophilia bacterium]
MDHLEAAQPRIVGLFLVTVVAAMLLAGDPGLMRILAVAVPTALTVGGAAMLNNFLERDIDTRMERTRRRPIATGRIPAGRALVIGLALVAAGSLAVWAVAGGLAAAFALLGAAYYVVVYTMLLKPRTPLSSIPGALAGVFPALIGWAATGAAWSGSILFLCALVFVWSPPHFWALALAREDDYIASGIPTPAVAYGERACRLLIAGFVAAVTVLTLVPAASGVFGALYLAAALAAGAALWVFTARLLTRRDGRAAWALFKVTGPYLAVIVAAAVLGHLLGH